MVYELVKRQGRFTARRLVWLCLGLTIIAAITVEMGRLTDAPGLLLFTAKLVFLGAAAGAAFLTLARRSIGEVRTIEWAKNLALLFATLAVTAVLAEFGLRIMSAGITTTGDNSSYWARRWYSTHVRVNSLGYREREFPAKKPPGVYRIAVVGDSFTFGQGIKEEDRFSNRLERALNREGQRFEVLNFGRPGAETVDEVEMLKNAVIGVKPDFVLLQWLINDVEGHDKSGRPAELPLLPSETLRPVLHRNSVLYYILDRQWGTLQHELGWTGSYLDYMRARFGDPESAGSREAAAELEKFVALYRERHIALGIVLFREPRTTHRREYPFAFLHERVLAYCSREGIDCFDLREPMDRAEEHASLVVNRFDGHPNAEANGIAAEEILNRFGPIWDHSAVDRNEGAHKG
jgi:hypothetical protein